MHTQNPHPGKFEGNHSQMVAEAVYDASMLGCHRECGAVDEGGWYGLIHGKRYSFILAEDNYGFVDVRAYTSREEAERDFDEWESMYAEEDSVESEWVD